MIYTEESCRRLRKRHKGWRRALAFLALFLLAGMYLICRDVDPIQPGPRQFYASLFLVTGGWIGLFMIFHGLLPARRDLRHGERMEGAEGEEKRYAGIALLEDGPRDIPGSIRVRRVALKGEGVEKSLLLWERAAKGFPREGSLILRHKNGYITAWQEVENA